jgi:hypothetical protein
MRATRGRRSGPMTISAMPPTIISLVTPMSNI